MALDEKQIADLKQSLRRCKPEIVDAIIRFRQVGDRTLVPTIVMGIIERYLPAENKGAIAHATDETRLAEDLGIDSLTMLEVVLSIEEALGFRVEDTELRGIHTMGEVLQFLDKKLTQDLATSITKTYTAEEIKVILPQQPPFLFVEEASINGDHLTGSYLLRGTENFFDGHFKNDPVVPAAIVFETLGQACCLWVLETVPKRLNKQLLGNQVVFATLDGAHFYKRGKPGDRLDIEANLTKLRSPLAIFEGTVKVNGERLAYIEKLVLAFDDELPVING